jgi:hypothetical protein
MDWFHSLLFKYKNRWTLTTISNVLSRLITMSPQINILSPLHMFAYVFILIYTNAFLIQLGWRVQITYYFLYICLHMDLYYLY